MTLDHRTTWYERAAHLAFLPSCTARMIYICADTDASLFQYETLATSTIFAILVCKDDNLKEIIAAIETDGHYSYQQIT